MDWELEIPRKCKDDELLDALKAIAGIIPGGSLLSYFIDRFLKSPYEERSIALLESIISAISELRSGYEELKPENLINNEMLKTLIIHAIPIAAKNHQQEKLVAIRNAVINGILPNSPSADIQLHFLNLLDKYTSQHLYMLKLADDIEFKDKILAEKLGIARLQEMKRQSAFPHKETCEAIYEDYAKYQVFYQRIARDLSNDDMIQFNAEGAIPALTKPNTTDLGRPFVAYISNPKRAE